MKKKNPKLKIVYKKELKQDPCTDPQKQIVKLVCEELNQILNLLDAEFEKPETTPPTSDAPPSL